MYDPQVYELLSFISKKWMYEIITTLSDGKKRFGEILEEIDIISNKMLSSRLSDLLEHGFIQKVVFSLLPLNIKYELQAKGKNLLHLYSHIQQYTDLLEMEF